MPSTTNETQRVPLNLKLSRKFYEREDVEVGTTGAQTSEVFIFKGVLVPKSGGIYRQYEGCHYPIKGFPEPQNLWACDIVKRYTMAFVNTLASKTFVLPTLAFLISPKKKQAINRAVSEYLRVADYTLASVYLKKKYYCECARGIRLFLTFFLIELGINRDDAERVGKVFSTLIQNDDIYRYRVQDIMSCFEQSDFSQNPRKAIKKAMKIIAERDKMIGDKFIAYGKILNFLLLIPKVKKAFVTGIINIRFKDLQFDEVDRYHAHLYTGYDFFGMTDEQRIENWYSMHGGIENCPPRIEVTA